VKTLDRYLLREVLPPFLIALGLFTFLLAVNPMLDKAQLLLSKGVSLPTVAFLLVTLLPQALGLTIPMAFLAGLLMGLGRLSGDREAVALLACGVSPLRLLRPILVLAILTAGVDLYVMTSLIPNSNQRFREVTFHLLAQQGESDIKAGVFYDGFPGYVLFVQATRPEGGWSGVMLADMREPGRPSLTLAPFGNLELDPVKRQVAIVLPGQSNRYVSGQEEGVYDTARAEDFRFSVSADAVFGSGEAMLGRGNPEMTIADLRTAEAAKRAAGVSPHPEIIQRHQMFSFPVACLVFALIGVSLGIHTRKEGKLGGFTLGIAVIFAYYGIMQMAEGLTKGGQLPAEWSRWVPNIIIGLLGIASVWGRTRHAGRDVSIRLPSWVRLPGRHGGHAGALSPAAGGRVVLVIRLPELPLPHVRILDRYVSRRYLSVAALSFCGLLGLYYIGTFIDKTERLFKGQADGWLIVKYLYFSTPQFIVHVVPMATLVAVLATIGSLTRTGELIVMRACGLSLYRVAAPLLLLSLVWSGALFVLDDRVLAHASRRADALETEIKGNLQPSQSTMANTNWLSDGHGRIYYYRAFINQTLYALSVFETTANGSRLASHTYTQRAVYQGHRWAATTGWVQRFRASDRVTRELFTARSLNLDPPEKFAGLHNQAADLLTFGQLRRQIADLADSGVSMTESRVQLYERLAFPLVTLVMTLLGVPFGLTTGRRGALYGVGLAMVLGAGYWLLNTFFVAVGRADLLHPLLAAWATNILFLALALYAMLTVRT
jgi:LPS export ABC transporter permease LptG/LPS export ABC transporter permease LptF